MLPGVIIKKIPGYIPSENKKEKQGFIEDITSLTKPALIELLGRQNKMIENRSFISRLPDKGAKILRFKETLEKELGRRNAVVEELESMMSAFNLDGAGDRLEWTGKCAPGGGIPCDVIEAEPVDTEDQTDPLRILATHAGTAQYKKQFRVLQPEQPLITKSDLVELEPEINGGIPHMPAVEEVYARNLCVRCENRKEKERYLPHRTIKERTNKSDVASRSTQSDSKLLSLEESIVLQINQAHHIKEVQLKHATEQLGDAFRTVTVGNLAGFSPEYREQAQSSSDEDEDRDEEQKVVDEEDMDRGGVVFIVHK